MATAGVADASDQLQERPQRHAFSALWRRPADTMPRQSPSANGPGRLPGGSSTPSMAPRLSRAVSRMVTATGWSNSASHAMDEEELQLLGELARAQVVRQAQREQEQAKAELAGAAEELREAYCAVFDTWERDKVSLGPDWWHQQFKETGTEVAQAVPAVAAAAPQPAPATEADDDIMEVTAAAPAEPAGHEHSTSGTTVHVWCADKEYTHDVRSGADGDSPSEAGPKVVLIGRYAGCDVPLPQGGTSRLAAMLFLFPAQRAMVVVDPGGYWGVRTLSRSGNGPLQHSLPQDRRALLFDWGESVKLQLGTQELLINPRMCVVCLAKPRAVVFDCGHSACCLACVREMHAASVQKAGPVRLGRGAPVQTPCPICREPLDLGQMLRMDLERMPAVQPHPAGHQPQDGQAARHLRAGVAPSMAAPPIRRA